MLDVMLDEMDFDRNVGFEHAEVGAFRKLRQREEPSSELRRAQQNGRQAANENLNVESNRL